ncbi:DUF5133 domain-containing protein [Streptomyces sp. NPDC006368]|uniref:DUF5133 domain-containing protein n=1 Tax=Streptomyces sp. NPDC006368 TaxID=3156760 RepID=UPI0033B2B241
MLMAHPAMLSRLVEEYESLKALQEEADSPRVRQRLQDVACALCVSTGARDADAALAAARHQLSRADADALLPA